MRVISNFLLHHAPPGAPAITARARVAAVIAAALTALLVVPGCARTSPPDKALSLGRSIPLPPRALLEPNQPPNCAANPTPSPTGPDSAAEPTADPEIGARAATSRESLAYTLQLEFERDCLSEAERTARRNLARLQAAVRKTTRAIRKIDTNPPKPTHRTAAHDVR